MRGLVLVGLALLCGAIGVVVARAVVGAPDGPEVVAELATARGLTEGADVRVRGAVAGRVEELSLTGRGTALVRLRLHEGLAPLRRDATAVVRPSDLLGDVHLEVSAGTDAAPLDGRIALARTANQPRLDELLAAFDGPVRAGLRALLVESGRALEARGAELGRATVELRPALQAADGVLRELRSQRAALGPLVRDASRAADELAASPAALERLVGGLDRTLGATAAGSRDLAAAVDGAPRLLASLRRTASGLRGVARDATPLAGELGAAAPGLARSASELEPALRRVREAAPTLARTAAALRGVLREGRTTFAALSRGLSQLGGVADEVDALSAAVAPAAPAIGEGFFRNFADQGAEPGRQPFDPFTDPRRGYWRGAAIFSCEAFGVEVRPGCLQEALGGPAPARRERTSREAPATAPATPAPARETAPLVPPLRKLPEVVRPVTETVGRAGEQVRESTQGLLDFLLGGGR